MSHARIMSLVAVALVLSASNVANSVSNSALAQGSTQQAVPASIASPLENTRAAIAECRERRLRKELASYKESAECASPKIFAAWREANYPYMDLLTAWLNAREEASAQVDQKAITPKEFERQMGLLTNRLTAEEQRRRSGLVNAADSDLQLQLPPSAQVMGAAAQPGQEKLAARRSAAARAAAASAPAAIGGSFVPVSGTQTAALSAPAPGVGGLYAHVASQRSEAEARAAFRSLQSQYPNILGGRDAVILRADDSDGTYYRVEVGPLTAGQADQICGTLRAAGGRCVTRSE